MNTDIQTYNPDQQRQSLLEAYNPHDHILQWTAFNKKTGLTDVVKYYPAAWRLYELNLKYPDSHFDIDIIHMDVERDFCIIRAKLYTGDVYESSPRRAVAHKQGRITQLDKVETQAKARAARDLGISTELALDIDDAPVGEVIGSAVIVNETNEVITDSTQESPRQLPEPAKVNAMKPKVVKAAQGQGPDSKLLPGQHNALKSLYLRLEQDIPPDLDNWTFAQAAACIQGLQAQLKAS